MRTITIPNVPDEVHRTLRARAAGYSTEAEIRDILEQAAGPSSQVLLGMLLAEIGREAGLAGDEAKIFDELRDRSPADQPDFG